MHSIDSAVRKNPTIYRGSINEGYRARRAAKHAAQKAGRTPATPILTQTIDLMPRVPRLSWLNGKTRPQSAGGRSGVSRTLPEHTEALVENGSRTLAAAVEKILNPPAQLSLAKGTPEAL